MVLEEKKEEAKEKFENIFLVYLAKSRAILLDKEKEILPQLEKILDEEIGKRGWQIDREKRHVYQEIAVSFYYESIADHEFLIKRKRGGSFNIPRTQLEFLYKFEKEHLGYSFEEESRNVSADINNMINQNTPENEAANLLLKKYAMITTSTFLALENNLKPNLLPDFALAKAKRKIVDDYFRQN